MGKCLSYSRGYEICDVNSVKCYWKLKVMKNFGGK